MTISGSCYPSNSGIWIDFQRTSTERTNCYCLRLPLKVDFLRRRTRKTILAAYERCLPASAMEIAETLSSQRYSLKGIEPEAPADEYSGVLSRKIVWSWPDRIISGIRDRRTAGSCRLGCHISGGNRRGKRSAQIKIDTIFSVVLWNHAILRSGRLIRIPKYGLG